MRVLPLLPASWNVCSQRLITKLDDEIGNGLTIWRVRRGGDSLILYSEDGGETGPVPDDKTLRPREDSRILLSSTRLCQ